MNYINMDNIKALDTLTAKHNGLDFTKVKHDELMQSLDTIQELKTLINNEAKISYYADCLSKKNPAEYLLKNIAIPAVKVTEKDNLLYTEVKLVGSIATITGLIKSSKKLFNVTNWAGIVQAIRYHSLGYVAKDNSIANDAFEKSFLNKYQTKNTSFSKAKITKMIADALIALDLTEVKSLSVDASYIVATIGKSTNTKAYQAVSLGQFESILSRVLHRIVTNSHYEYIDTWQDKQLDKNVKQKIRDDAKKADKIAKEKAKANTKKPADKIVAKIK